MTRPREGDGRASSAQSPGIGNPRSREQGGYGAGPTVSHLFKKGAHGVGVEKEKEIKSYTANFQQEATSTPRGPERHPSWVAQGSEVSSEAGLDPGTAPCSGSRISGARANAGRGAAQSETATIRVRLHSFESFFPGV